MISKSDLEHILEHTRTLAGELKNKSIFITGGTGFFGKWLLESFIYLNEQLDLNSNMTVLSRNPADFLASYPQFSSNRHLKFVEGNILDFEFPSGEFNFIIHAATEADAKQNDIKPLLMLDTITNGTRRILEFARIQKVESFLLASSGAVYGKQPSHIKRVTETEGFFLDINDHASSYAEGKRVAELYASTYYSKFNLPVKISRSFAFVGPYLPLDKHFAIGNFIRNVLRNEDIIIKGDGQPYRSYLYAADLVIWLWTILIKGKNNYPYNVGSDHDLQLCDVAKEVARNNTEVKVQILTPANKDKPAERYIPDISRAKTLGLDVRINLQDAIKKTLEFYSETAEKDADS